VPERQVKNNERKYVLRNQNMTQRRSIKVAVLTAAVACVFVGGVEIRPSLARAHWSAAEQRNEGAGDAFFGAFARGKKRDLGSRLSGIASVYHDRLTANGEHMNPGAMTAAHKTLPFGSRVTVTNHRNGRSATVRINDRGPYVRGRVIDLSPGAARVLGVDGLAPVSLMVGGRRV
jgi:rare lipoprotein A